MQIAKYLTSSTLLAVAVALTPIELEFYGDTNCQSVGDVSAVRIAEEGICYDLDGAGLAFHIGSPASQSQVPEGYSIQGFADAGCTGGLNVQISGPSDAGQCYVVGTNMGQQYPVKSAILVRD